MPLVALTFAFMLAGIFLGENRVVAYGLIGSGILSAVADFLHLFRSHYPSPYTSLTSLPAGHVCHQALF